MAPPTAVKVTLRKVSFTKSTIAVLEPGTLPLKVSNARAFPPVT